MGDGADDEAADELRRVAAEVESVGVVLHRVVLGAPWRCPLVGPVVERSAGAARSLDGVAVELRAVARALDVDGPGGGGPS